MGNLCPWVTQRVVSFIYSNVAPNPLLISSSLAMLSASNSTSLALDLKAIKTALNSVQNVVFRLARARNMIKRELFAMTCRDGIALLPPEILGQVFEIAIELVKPDAVRMAISISHVCQSWRTLAVGMPSLWTTVELWGCWEKITTFLERSKHSLIDIHPFPSQREW